MEGLSYAAEDTVARIDTKSSGIRHQSPWLESGFVANQTLRYDGLCLYTQEKWRKGITFRPAKVIPILLNRRNFLTMLYRCAADIRISGDPQSEQKKKKIVALLN